MIDKSIKNTTKKRWQNQNITVLTNKSKKISEKETEKSEFQIDELKTQMAKTEDIVKNYIANKYEYHIGYVGALENTKRLEKVSQTLGALTMRDTILDAKIDKLANSDVQTAKNDISALQTKIATNSTNIANLQTQQATNTQNITALQDTTSALQDSFSTLSTQQSTNTSSIAKNSQEIATNASDIATIKTEQSTQNSNIAQNAQNNATLQSLVTQHAVDIASLQNSSTNLQSQVAKNSQDIATNTSEIATLKNSQSSTDTSALQTQITQNATDIASIKTEQSTQNQNINTLLAFKQSFDTPVDPNYNPKTFSDYPAGTILQGYAEFKRKYNKQYRGTLTTPKMVFSAEANSSGTLKLHIEFTSTTATTILLTLYNNDTSIYTETITFDSTACVIDTDVLGITLADGNVFYATIGATDPYNTYLTFTFVKAGLVAPNAEVINQISPYAVDYFNGKYYVSDCTGGTAKIAEINVEDMHNMDNLTWTDTGIECWQYKTSFLIELFGSIYQPTDRIDYYHGIDEKIYFENKTKNTTQSIDNCEQADWFQSTENSVFYATKRYEPLKYLHFISYTPTSLNSIYREAFDYATISSAKYLSNFFDNACERKYGAFTRANNQIYGDCYHNTGITPVLLGKGTRSHCYFESATNSIAKITCYYKCFDKIIKSDFQYQPSPGMALNATTEIGAYEEYFEGANSDYFVVKNGKLEYYKKS